VHGRSLRTRRADSFAAVFSDETTKLPDYDRPDCTCVHVTASLPAQLHGDDVKKLARELITIQIPTWMDTSIAGLRNPYKPKDPSLTNALSQMAMDAMNYGQGFSRISPLDVLGDIRRKVAERSRESRQG